MPAALDAVFQKMLAKSPADRYQSMTAVVAALEVCVAAKQRQPIAAEPSGDRALTSFLQHLAEEDATPKPPPRLTGEPQETIKSHVEQETGTPFWKRLVPPGKPALTMYGWIALGVAAFVVVAGLLFALVGGRDGAKPKEAEEVAVAGEEEDLSTSAEKPPPFAVSPFDADEARQHQQAWADYLGVPGEWENSLGMKFVLIPPGEFLMGATAEEQARFLDESNAAEEERTAERISSEGPQHRVRITKPFALSRHEITRGEFRQFVEETGYETSAKEDGEGGWGLRNGRSVQDPQFVWSTDLGFPQTDDHPVVNVSWKDATAFCRWLSKKQGVKYALPTEAQWEYACRAGTTTLWHCGDSDTTLEECAWVTANSGGKTHPAGQLKPNAWGLYDMHGSVWEWCADWHGADHYAHSLPSDPSGPTTGSRRVYRGGSWNNFARHCRSAHRNGLPPDYRFLNLGFRLASVLVDE